jgi:hypothetical protein
VALARDEHVHIAIDVQTHGPAGERKNKGRAR